MNSTKTTRSKQSNRLKSIGGKTTYLPKSNRQPTFGAEIHAAVGDQKPTRHRRVGGYHGGHGHRIAAGISPPPSAPGAS